MEERRLQRVSEAMREELAEIVGFELTDPRIGAVSVTDVHVSPDSRHARVRVALSGKPEERKDSLEALEGARHYVRRELARRLELFRIPEIHFEADALVDPSRLDVLIKRIRKGRPRSPAPDEGSSKKNPF